MVEFLTCDSVLSLLPVLLYTVEPPADRLVGTFTVNRFQSTDEMKQRGLRGMLTTFVCVCKCVCVCVILRISYCLCRTCSFSN